MTTQHTSGPWHWSGDSLTHRQFDIYAPTQAPYQHVCTINNLPVEKLYARDAAVALANARLIAAAPDLLDACRCALADMEGLEVDGEDSPAFLTIQELKAAIAKATGGAP